MAWTKDQKIAAFLSLGLIPLFMAIVSGAKEVCYKGQIMWTGMAGSHEAGWAEARVVCDPHAGPFRAELYVSSAMQWKDMGSFQHVDDARAALEAIG